MAHSNNWDETQPTNSTNATSIDDEIRKVRLDVRERMAVDHDINSSDSAEAEIGIHKQVTLKAEIAAPTPSQNGQSIIYRNSSDNDRELRHAVKDANGTVVQDKLVFVGEVKLWLGLEANIPTGWLPLKGATVGSATSGATYAGAVYQDLYYHLWNNLDDTASPVTGGRGASAAADFSANKPMLMPDARSRMPIGAGLSIHTVLPFTSGGTHEVLVGDVLTGHDSGAYGTVVDIKLRSGSWAGGDAVGVFTLRGQIGVFQAENLDEGANLNVCTIAGNATNLSTRTVGRVSGFETKDIMHDHDHTHQWYDGITGSGVSDKSFDVDGDPLSLTQEVNNRSGGLTTICPGDSLASQDCLKGDYWTDKDSTDGGTPVQDVMNPWIAIWMIIKY